MAEPLKKPCAQCSAEIPVFTSHLGTDKTDRMLSGKNICGPCYDEISTFMISGNNSQGWKYDEFVAVEQKYPNIFEQGFYQKPATRIALGLLPVGEVSPDPDHISNQIIDFLA